MRLQVRNQRSTSFRTLFADRGTLGLPAGGLELKLVLVKQAIGFVLAHSG